MAALGFLVFKYNVAVHAALVALEHGEEGKRRPIRRQRKVRKRRSRWVKYWLSQEQMLHQSHYYNLLETLREKDPDGFRNYTRLPPEMFDELLDRTRPLIVQQATTYRVALEPGLKLAVTIRYLATGNSYVDLAYSFRVANNSISIFVPEVCQAILDEFVDELIPSPNTKERWQLISDEFKNRWNVPNACGALDGKHVAIKKPAKSGSQYYNYHSFLFYCYYGIGKCQLPVPVG